MNQIEKECGCYVEVEVCDDGTFYPITYCAEHGAASDLLDACEVAKEWIGYVIKPTVEGVRDLAKAIKARDQIDAAISKAKGA